MMGYGKSTQNAIAAMSLLAQAYDGGTTRFSSAQIARVRQLPQPFVAKLMTILAQAGLVNGSPGPGGGYTLARPPQQITLYDVTAVFERENEPSTCPFGGGWCGSHDPCPLHEQIIAAADPYREFLRQTSFAVFCDTPGTELR